ncbi:MAG: hypothetical protein M5F18_09290, partial [Asgard group archaeon]|nr:hypothetical protein [Asgard group archaeon]
MKFITIGLLVSALFTKVTPKEITGVFTSFNSLTYFDAGNYGYQGPGNPTWTSTLGWSLDGSVASPGDTFTLIMPCVFKFTSPETSVDLTVDGVSYATCNLNNGEEFTTFSSMSCVVSSALTSTTQALGAVSIPFSFNVGGSGSSVDLEDATCFTAGTNTVTFKDGDNELSINAVFDKTTASVSDEIISVRSVPSIGKLQQISIAKDCPSGYGSGYMSIIIKDNTAVMDCSSVHIGITNELNDWNQPMNSESFSYTKSCSATEFIVSFTDIAAGYRPFMDSFLTTTGNAKLTVDYHYEYTCKNGDTVAETDRRIFSPYTNSNTGCSGVVLVITTRTGTQTTTAVTTLPFDPSQDHTKTIEVIEPIPTTTITTSYLGITTSYSTISGTVGGTATVIVDEPYHSTTTVYTSWAGVGTTSHTITASTDSIDTVFVETPVPNHTVTTTEYEDVSAATTYTETATHGGTDTVHIIDPLNPTVTTTEYEDISVATTYTETATHGGTDTVHIIEPVNPTVTTTEFGSVSEATTITYTNPAGETDTILVIDPLNPTVTTTEFGSVSEATTITYTN